MNNSIGNTSRDRQVDPFIHTIVHKPGVFLKTSGSEVVHREDSNNEQKKAHNQEGTVNGLGCEILPFKGCGRIYSNGVFARRSIVGK